MKETATLRAILTSNNSMTLYVFDKDTAGSGSRLAGN